MNQPQQYPRNNEKYFTPNTHSLESLLANIAGMVYRGLADRARTMLFASAGALELSGYRPEDLVGTNAVPFGDLMLAEDREHVDQAIRASLENGGRYEVEYRILTKSGEMRWVCERGSAISQENGSPTLLEGLIQDISRQKSVVEDLQETERRYRSIFENAVEGIYQSTLDHGYLAVNPALARIYGYASPSQLIHRLRDINTQLYVEPGRRREFVETMERHGVVSNFESRVYCRDGSVIWISENARAVRNEAGNVLFYEGTVEDITQRKIIEADIHFRATHDPLTKLPNRTLLQERLDQAIHQARRAGKCVAALFLDLDKFKYINDNLGHHVGDELLLTVAERLRHCVGDGDTVARLGGDEFVLVLENQADGLAVEKAVERVLAKVAQPWTVDGMRIQVTCSVGVSMYPAHGENAWDLLKHADMAMFEAKRVGRNNFQYFTKRLDGAMANRLEIIAGLRRALESGELHLHYQAKCALATGRVVGAEALIRWQKPGYGLIGPNEFIPVAEEAGLMGELGQWVLRTACRQNREWQMAGNPAIPVSVNISPLQLEKGDLFEQVASALAETGLPPQYLEIEITESGMMRNVEKSMDTLRRLKELGIILSIDDFGTGYSSLSHLKRLPLDTLKIDKGFIHDIPTDHENASIVAAVISLAHALKLKVVAEGVETEAEYTFLRGMCCDEIQGYYRGRPVAQEAFAALYLQPGDGEAPAVEHRAHCRDGNVISA